LLRRSDYEAIGGVAGALASHADGVLDGLLPDDLRAARALLLRMVTPEGTRRVVGRAQLLEGTGRAGAEVARRLTEARLISVRRARDAHPDGGELELAHESLVRTWKTLARWIDEGREEIALIADIEQAAQAWQRRGRRPEDVFTGPTLLHARGSIARLGAR